MTHILQLQSIGKLFIIKVRTSLKLSDVKGYNCHLVYCHLDEVKRTIVVWTNRHSADDNGTNWHLAAFG
jgi:hypothetical protein